MAAPNATLTVRENGLNLQPPSTAGRHVKMGASSQGTVGTLYEFNTYDQVRSTIGYGPLADAVVFALGELTQGVAPAPVLAMRATASTAATSGSVTPTRTSTSTGTVATTGSTPYDSYSVQLVVVQTGALGAGTFKYSLDGGAHFSPEIVIPSGGTYAIPNTGITAVFTAGAGPIIFEAGDLFAWTTVEPKCTTTNLNSAWTSLLADPRTWGFAHVVGVAADQTDLASRWDAMSTNVNNAAVQRRHVRCFIEGPTGVSDATLIAAMAIKQNSRMVVSADVEDLTVPDTGNKFRRSVAWVQTARVAAIPIHEDPARVKSGAVSSNNIALVRDENITPGLDDARFSTMRTWIKRSGLYITNVKLFSAAGSDLRYIQHGRVIDVACDVTYFGLVNQASENFRVDPVPVTDPTTGLKYNRILEQDARMIESEIQELLNDALLRPGHVSDVKFALSRTDAVLTSETLTSSVSVVPLGYAKALVSTVSFVNPARLATAA